MFNYKINFKFFEIIGFIRKESQSDEFDDILEEVFYDVRYCSKEKIKFIIEERKRTDWEVNEIEIEYQYSEISKEKYLHKRKEGKEINKLFFIKETRKNQKEVYVHALRYCLEQDIIEKLKTMKNKNQLFFVDYSYHELAIEAIELDENIEHCYDHEHMVIYDQDFLYTLEDLIDFQCKNGRVEFEHTYENESGFIIDDAKFDLTYKII